MSSNNDIPWNDVIKKEARGLEDNSLGEVKEVSDKYLITEKGVIDKDRFYIPKKFVIHIDGQYVWLKIKEDEAKQYKSD